MRFHLSRNYPKVIARPNAGRCSSLGIPATWARSIEDCIADTAKAAKVRSLYDPLILHGPWTRPPRYGDVHMKVRDIGIYVRSILSEALAYHHLREEHLPELQRQFGSMGQIELIPGPLIQPLHNNRMYLGDFYFGTLHHAAPLSEDPAGVFNVLAEVEVKTNASYATTSGEFAARHVNFWARGGKMLYETPQGGYLWVPRFMEGDFASRWMVYPRNRVPRCEIKPPYRLITLPTSLGELEKSAARIRDELFHMYATARRGVWWPLRSDLRTTPTRAQLQPRTWIHYITNLCDGHDGLRKRIHRVYNQKAIDLVMWADRRAPKMDTVLRRRGFLGSAMGDTRSLFGEVTTYYDIFQEILPSLKDQFGDLEVVPLRFAQIEDPEMRRKLPAFYLGRFEPGVLNAQDPVGSFRVVAEVDFMISTQADYELARKNKLRKTPFWRTPFLMSYQLNDDQTMRWHVDFSEISDLPRLFFSHGEFRERARIEGGVFRFHPLSASLKQVRRATRLLVEEIVSRHSNFEHERLFL